jgi:AbrB family looped-hinge helix DNA binding protein
MPLVTVKNKFQIVIPAAVRKQAKIRIGDLLEARFEKGKLSFEPRSVVDRGIAESIEAIRNGRFIGPFDNAKDAMKALRSKPRR